MIIKAQYNAAFRAIELDALHATGPAIYILPIEDARELKKQLKKAIKEAEDMGL